MEGVRERNGKIVIDFYYQRIRQRKTLNLEATPKNLKYAARLRAAILFDIKNETYEPDKYFSVKIASTRLRDLFQVQLQRYQRRYKNKALALSTLVGYQKLIKRLIEELGHFDITEITTFDLKQWLYKLEHRRKTIRNLLTPLSKIFRSAVADGIIAKNPMEKLDLEDILLEIGIAKLDSIKPFDENERSILINKATGQFKNLIQFAMYSGLRTGELIALQWSDIDFKLGIIKVSRNKVYGENKAPKTKSGTRTVIMLPKAREALLNQRQFTHDKVIVFDNPNTNQPWASDAPIRKQWLKLFIDGEVEYRYPYQTRHTYASMLLSNGENIAWIATQMGHTTTEMITRNYGKFIPDNSVANGYKLKGKNY